MFAVCLVLVRLLRVRRPSGAAYAAQPFYVADTMVRLLVRLLSGMAISTSTAEKA